MKSSLIGNLGIDNAPPTPTHSNGISAVSSWTAKVTHQQSASPVLLRSWSERMDSFKYRHSQRDHHPSCAPSVENLHAGVLQDTFPLGTSIVHGENGKKRFPATYSITEEFKPGMRLVPHKMHSETIEERGKKAIIPLNSELKVDYPKRKSTDSLRRSASSDLPIIGWTTKRTVLLESGEPVYNFKSRVEKLEDTMQQKQRIKTELQKRNFVPIATPGDKAFHDADREPGFYAKGGIIPGSTIQLRKSAKPTLRKSEDVSNTMSKKPLEATYSKMQARLSKEYDVNQVRTLTIPVVNSLGQTVASWEDRTGFYLVRPEDEAY